MTISATTNLLQRMAKVEETTDERFDDEELNREEAAIMNALVSKGLVREVAHNDSAGEFVFCSYELTTIGRSAATVLWY